MAMSLPSRCHVLQLNRILNGIAFWCVVALAMLFTFASGGTGCNTKSKAYVTAMKSDLRNMMSAQEAFRAEHGRFADAAALESGLLAFRSSTGVLIALDRADADGWSATTQHQILRGATCSIGSGEVDINCRVPEPKRPIRLTGRWALDWAIDLWLMAFSLGRRQRRLMLLRQQRAAIATAWRESLPAA
jgi:hypothetical protein